MLDMHSHSMEQYDDFLIWYIWYAFYKVQIRCIGVQVSSSKLTHHIPLDILRVFA